MKDQNLSIKDQGQNVKQIIFDQKEKSLNVFNESMIISLNKALDVIEEDTSTSGVIFTSAKKDFIVGADIEEIEKINSVNEAVKASQFLQNVINRVENLKCPSVAAISGQCFGGGLEFAIACSFRIVSENSKTLFSFPEVMLGLMPGAGGTQRSPKIIGIQNALDLMLTGKKIGYKQAKRMGLVDDVVPESFLIEISIGKVLSGAKKYNDGSFAKKISTELPKWATDKNSLGRKIMESKAKEILDKKSNGHYPAPYKILDAVFNNYDKPLKEGLMEEANLFGRLSQTRECHSLVHVFHCVTHAKKIENHIKSPLTPFKAVDSIVGVIGGGLMGGGIAQICAKNGIKTRITDPNKDSIGRLLKRMTEYLDLQLKRHKIDERQKNHIFNRISPALDQRGLSQCDIVIEAVFEDIQLKSNILREVLEKGPDHQIVATNTSAIPIMEIKKNLPKKENVIGMHFFSPVEKMPLLEIIRCVDTPDWVLEKAFKLGTKIGKNIIVVNDGPGFYTTRVLAFYLGEAMSILEEGIDIKTIDAALMDFGFPIGPISLIDEVGIDVGCHVLSTISEAFPGRIAKVNSDILADEQGRLGKKSSKGFYKYLNGKRLDPDTDFIAKLVKNSGKQSNDVSASLHSHDIIDRCMLIFVNEAFRCLEDNIIESPKDGDLGSVFGLGFPAFWGGPFKYVDHMGANTIVDRLESLAEKYGERFLPSPILKEYADANKKIFS